MTREERRAKLIESYERYRKYPSHSWHTVQHLLDLDDRYPEVGMFEDSCISCDVGPGWADLLEEALIAIRDAGGKLEQAKQKFCALRVYWDGPKGRGVREKLAELEERSMRVCERCGGEYTGEGAGRPMAGTRLCDSCRAGIGAR